MKIDINKKTYNCLLTCYHSITEEDIKSNKNIYIFFGKSQNETKIKIKLNKNKRFIKCLEQLDVTIIEILKTDNIKEDKFLFPDLNYINGYSQYINNPIYTGGYPCVEIYNKQRHISSGKIVEIKDGIITHKCDTRYGSSGSPLIDNKKRVIGIHFGFDEKRTKNYGTFIGNILEELNSKFNIDKNPLKFENSLKKNKKNKVKEQLHNKEEDQENKDQEAQEDHVEPNINILENYFNDVLKISGLEGIDPQLLGQIYQNPIMINLMKEIVSNPKLMEEYKNLPQIKEFIKINPFAKISLENPELMKLYLNPEYMKFLSQIFISLGNNNTQNNNAQNKNKIKEFDEKKNFMKNKESYIDDDDINFNKIIMMNNEKMLIKFNEMGFTNDKLNLKLLKKCDGDFDKTLNLLLYLEKNNKYY